MDDLEKDTKRPCCVSLCPVRKSALHLWFKVLLLFCVGFLVIFSSASWWNFSFHEHYQNIFNWTSQLPKSVFSGPGFRLNEVTETKNLTSRLPTAAPTGTLYHPAYPRNYDFIMDNKEVCKSKTPFLVLMVPVTPQNREARNAIRQTWGNESLVQGEVVLTLFMLGLPRNADDEQKQKLDQENLQYHDLIQSSFMDSYLNLTTKTMVIMDWLATRCPTAAYAMKVDSDMFLNIDNLVKMLTLPGIPKWDYLTGMLMVNREVIRYKESKWYVPEELYPDSRYPTYTLGMGYVFSNDLPKKFVEASKSINPFNIEDAYIGMCMKQLGLKPTSPPNPWQFQAYNTKYDRCIFSRVITFILGSSQEMLNYWTDLKKPGAPC
ncbi:beta-1,3-galactosyltransferase 2-like [Solea senegalensis]|uniref:Hexosyltransferase n=1 Tax=Solea senegalensis TaxID=28829 RepID=A0AAV6QCR4_SOLSE|nr:beta-1,3-galactosyltransferase 2-like [Solea senegalensis]KAG7486946.1 beta-1,3-galactosyltransferase 2-like [Solea senegalensis]